MERLSRSRALWQALLCAMKTAVDLGQQQDTVKRAIFYGKPGLIQPLANDSNLSCYQDDFKRLQEDPRLIRLLHSFLGKCTEAAELQEHLMAVLFEGKPLDLINVKEEFGDGEWYD